MRPRSTNDAKFFAREMRTDMTISERRAWNALKGRRLGVRFRRQVPIGPYIVDFACLEKRLVIEIDDPSHQFRDESERNAYLEARGFEIIRFTNEFVAKVGVAESIENWLSQHP
jgi:BirA family biotin operon repressor/biotin-[acetyl-CoA-carboxylase] ligase